MTSARKSNSRVAHGLALCAMIGVVAGDAFGSHAKTKFVPTAPDWPEPYVRKFGGKRKRGSGYGAKFDKRTALDEQRGYVWINGTRMSAAKARLYGYNVK